MGDVGYAIQINQLPQALSALYFDLKVRTVGFDDPAEFIIGLVELADRLTEDQIPEEDDDQARNS